MAYFNAYPVTPDMGLRESINAMLYHVADNSYPFGYLPSAIHQANYLALLEDYADIIEPDSAREDYLVLKTRVEDSELLEDLVETLIGLCNDYPAYDVERVSEIEQERLIDMLEETREEDHPSAMDIAYALFEMGAYIEQSEYGANVSEDDYKRAVEYVRREETHDLAKASGQVELF